jgi:hypothetical protein
VIGLGVQVAELKAMVGQIVSTWRESPAPPAGALPPTGRLRLLEGSWLNLGSNSRVYVRMLHDTLVAPYCYRGNSELTAYYYGWREVGGYLFARFRWVDKGVRGFTFLKPSGADTLHGAWWYDGDRPADDTPDRPPRGSGNPVTWRRTTEEPPVWASAFFDRVARGQVAEYPADRPH